MTQGNHGELEVHDIERTGQHLRYLEPTFALNVSMLTSFHVGVGISVCRKLWNPWRFLIFFPPTHRPNLLVKTREPNNYCIF